MTNPTDIADSAFKEISLRVDERRTNPWFQAANGWGMDLYRARYFGREMACWHLLQAGIPADRAEKAESGSMATHRNEENKMKDRYSAKGEQ